MNRPALFRHYPLLADRLPRLPLLAGPTPVHRLLALEQRLAAGPLWVKRDDLTARPYGGNKPRKLEFLLGAARARGARTLITFGALGSNHVLATTVYGRRHGFEVAAMLVPRPVDDHVRTNLAAVHRLGARLVYAPTSSLAVVAAIRTWAGALARDRRCPYLILPGGSSPLGSLGYVDAAIELADQVTRGELPPPAAIFVANGSCGTAAGLLAGLRLAGLPARLVVVRVSDRLALDAAAITRLATATIGLLRQLAGDVIPALSFTPADFDVQNGYLGPGYGHLTPAGEHAVRTLAEAEGLTLEPTYTGKTMAALLDAVRRPEWRGRTVLYWHTYNSQPVDVLASGDDVGVWPEPFRRLLG